MIYDEASGNVYDWGRGHNGLDVYNIHSNEVRAICSDSPYRIHGDRFHGGRFVTYHREENTGIVKEIAVRSFASPNCVISRVVLDGDTGIIEDNVEVWKEVGECYVMGSQAVYLNITDGTYWRHRMPWFNEAEYDTLYQGVVGGVQIPGSTEVAVEVQRAEDVVVYDVARTTVVARLPIGRKSVYVRRSAELWSTASDRLAVYDSHNWELKDVMQLTLYENTASMHIRACGTDPSAEVFLVIRGSVGDIIIVDVDSRVVKRTLHLRRPVEDAVLCEGGVVVCRMDDHHFRKCGPV